MLYSALNGLHTFVIETESIVVYKPGYVFRDSAVC